MKFKALVLKKPGDVSVEYIDAERVDVFPDANIVVRMLAASICGTDIEIFSGEIPTRKLPIVMGHEGVGEIVDIRRKDQITKNFEIGDKVLIDPNIIDYVCPMCRAGKFNLCLNGGLMGRDYDGLIREYIEISGRQLYKLPKNLDLEIGPLLQPLSTVIHAQNKARITPGNIVLIVGTGNTGLMHVQVAKLRGATVIAIGRDKAKVALARSLGADFGYSILDYTLDEIKSEIYKLTDQEGVDILIDATNDGESIMKYIDLVKPGGTIISFGTSKKEIYIPQYSLYIKELVLIAPRSSNPIDFVEAIKIATSNKINLRALIRDRVPLDNAMTIFNRSKLNLKTIIYIK